MPQTEAEIIAFIGSKYFASPDFCYFYWQCPLDLSSYKACGIIASQGTFLSTCLLHRSKNTSAYFRSTFAPIFDSMKHAFKAWIKDFILFKTTKMDLLQHLDKFFTICGKHNDFFLPQSPYFLRERLSGVAESLMATDTNWIHRTSKRYAQWKHQLL